MKKIVIMLVISLLGGCGSQSGPTKAEVLARQKAEQELSEQRWKVLDDARACLRNPRNPGCDEKMKAVDAQTAEIQAEANAREVERAR